MKQSITKSGSVRVDLTGGTLDLRPISLVLPRVVTLNVATSLKTQVTITPSDYPGVVFKSADYQTTNQWSKADFTYENIYEKKVFGPLNFVVQILDYFKVNEHVQVEIAASIPPGSGLGGSSAMGVILFKALLDWASQSMTPKEVITIVNNIEARILDAGPAGYQDYYPALYGGVLALRATPGEVEVEQLYSDGLKVYLEKHLTLVYSGKPRNSGINNWEVYKSFFDKNEAVRNGLGRIAQVSFEAYSKIKSGNLSGLWKLIGDEGEERSKLFANILTPEMKELHQELVSKHGPMGMKACGAGGGGCYLIVAEAPKQDDIKNLIVSRGMKILDFKVEKSLY